MLKPRWLSVMVNGHFNAHHRTVSRMAWLASVITGLIEAFCQIWRKLVQIFQRWRAKRGLSERARRATPAECVPIREPAFHRPDPLIYSQYDLMQRGLAVTWYNPDIDVQRNGVSVSTTGLDPATEYEIVARIWNNSTDAPVVALPVINSYVSFGIGAQSHPIGLAVTNLGVKGGPDHPAFVRTKWRTPSEPGHYCIQVQLNPVDDTNFGNNLGQDNVVVGHPQSPAEFEFRLRNSRPNEQRVRFELDTYRIPPLRRCDEAPARPPEPTFPQLMVDGRPARPVPPNHDRREYPLPPGWSVEIDPAEPQLAPAEEITIHVRVTPPPNFIGKQSVNVNAFDAIGLQGGITIQVEAP